MSSATPSLACARHFLHLDGDLLGLGTLSFRNVPDGSRHIIDMIGSPLLDTGKCVQPALLETLLKQHCLMPGALHPPSTALGCLPGVHLLPFCSLHSHWPTETTNASGVKTRARISPLRHGSARSTTFSWLQ